MKRTIAAGVGPCGSRAGGGEPLPLGAILAQVRRRGSSRAAVGEAVLVVAWLFAGPLTAEGSGGYATNTFLFTYTNRDALLADGWSFIATTPTGAQRNTEVISPDADAVSYDQTNHPGVLRIPGNGGDLWGPMNNTTNSLFRNLSSNWVSVRLDVASFAPTANYQQVRLALYQDDDNYLEAGRGFNSSQGGQRMQFTREDGGDRPRYSPMTIAFTSCSATSFQLRLDRDLNTDAVISYYSEDNVNWLPAGGSSQALTNARLCIWAGNSPTPVMNCDLRRLEIVTTDEPLAPLLVAQPQHLVFTAVAGQAITNLQQVRLISRRSQDPRGFSVSTNAPWLVATTAAASTNTPGFLDVSVASAGLSAGTYTGIINCGAPGAIAASVLVTLIVNPASRAQVSTWRGGKSAAMSVWIDDSQPTAFDDLSTNGLQGTYVLSEITPIPSFFTSYYSAGMELGAHTVIHDCPVYGEARTRFEFETNIVDICAATPQPRDSLISFAYPCGLTTNLEQVVASDYFLVARGYNINQLEDASPYNFMNLKSFNSHEHDPRQFNPSAPPNPADLKTIVDAAVEQGKWFNLVLHTMNNDDGAIVYSLGKDIWVATGGSVSKYVLLRDRTVITNCVETTNSVSFDCYRLPLDASSIRSFETAIGPQDTLTFQVDLAGIASVSQVTVNGASVPFSSKVSGGKTNLLVNVQVTPSPQTVSLQISNSAPVLPAQADRTAGELWTLVVTNSAVDRDVPVQTLTYSLLDPPAGAQIDTNGLIRWTPDHSQLFNTYTLTTRVTDSGQPSLSATNSFLLTVKYLLTVSANNQSRTYGATNPSLTGTLIGVQAGDDITASYTTSANSNSPVGTYPIVPGLNDPNGKLINYFVVTNNGSLTIYRADTTVNAAVSANPCPTGSNLTLTATVTAVPPGSGTPGGSARFFLDGAAFGNAVPLAAGIATMTTTNVTHGSHGVAAQYSGDGNFNGSSNVLNGTLVINTTPVAGVLTVGAVQNRPMLLNASDFLAKCSDADGDALTLTSASTPSARGGAVTLNGSAVTYTPPVDYTGPDSFSYTVRDTFSATATNVVSTTVWTNVPLVITNVILNPDRTVQLVGIGIPELRYLVQAATNPLYWGTIATNAADTNGVLSYLDRDVTNYSSRFYRTAVP